jgi:hypothetical protein
MILDIQGVCEEKDGVKKYYLSDPVLISPNKGMFGT